MTKTVQLFAGRSCHSLRGVTHSVARARVYGQRVTGTPVWDNYIGLELESKNKQSV